MKISFCGRMRCRMIARLLGVFFGGAGLLGGLSGCSAIPVARSANRHVQCVRDQALAEQLRGLPLKQSVVIERETPEQLQTTLMRELDKEENRVFLSETEALLRQFRILKPDGDLKSVYLKVMSEQIAAYYDPEKKRVAYVEGGGGGTNSAALAGMERFVYVHEFCHAVDDSQFDLERLTTESLSSFDRSLALTSVIEGTAVLVGLDSVFAEVPVNTATPLGNLAVRVMAAVDLSGQMAEEMGDCPPFLSGTLLRPYLDGGVFVNRIRREAGWQAIDDIYRRRLPRTTAEILYPERRYMRSFEPAVIEPDSRLFCYATSGVSTNSLGALGTALWLGGDTMALASEFGFLNGWMGDRVYLLKDAKGVSETVWLSYWERPDMARSFCRQVRKRLKAGYGDTPWCVQQNSRLVAVVWAGSSDGNSASCEASAALGVASQVDVERPSWCASRLSDLPWPIRFPSFEGHSSGLELGGGHLLDVDSGGQFFGMTLADGVLLRAESNPDRHYYGTLCGLLRHVADKRSDFTYWRIPLLASWFRRGTGADEQYRWSLLWGFLGSGSETKARVLLIPVWHAVAADRAAE